MVINKKLVASFLQDFPVTGFHALCLIWCAFPTQASRSCCEGQGHGSELCMEAQQEFASSAISAARDADPLATPLALTVPPIVPFPAKHMARLMFWGKSWRWQTSSQGNLRNMGFLHETSQEGRNPPMCNTVVKLFGHSKDTGRRFMSTRRGLPPGYATTRSGWTRYSYQPPGVSRRRGRIYETVDCFNPLCGCLPGTRAEAPRQRRSTLSLRWLTSQLLSTLVEFRDERNWVGRRAGLAGSAKEWWRQLCHTSRVIQWSHESSQK